MKTIIVWYRNDLRVHDHPALAAAHVRADNIVPVFILNDSILSGERASSNRNRFLIESLVDLKKSLQGLGADLVIRHGDAKEELQKLISETNADAIYVTDDFTTYAIQRDKELRSSLSIKFQAFPGRLAVDSFDNLHTKLGNPHKVFTPFWKNWQQILRRDIAIVPTNLNMLRISDVGEIPNKSDLINKTDLAPDALPGGECAGRARLETWLADDIAVYHQTNNDMAANATSRLSAYLHFGCISVREIETMLPDNVGADAWHRQLAWREFYNYIIFKFPDNTTKEFQERYRNLKWDNNPDQLKSWKNGVTGYPVVDAAMRQLKAEGWMHNRARLIVGSFLTKDLWIDWRLGESHFMQQLIDGDQANNNGNWQWIASVGVDPAPVFRRLYNPTTQQINYDPTGEYVRRYVPELKKVPAKYIAEPWTMPMDVQQEVGCIIGTNYPSPIVDHKQARLEAMDHYRSAGMS